MHMNRRQWLRSAAIGSGASMLAGPTWGQNGLPQVNPNSWAQAFEAALAEKPWLLGYATATQPQFSSRASVKGKWPAELSGTFYRNGPARHEIGDFRYQHWFDGDGMMQAYQISPDGVTHQARFVATRKYLAELDAGRALYPGFATAPPDPAPVTSPDAVNVANISVLHHHGKLMALWEAGSPWEMDPSDLSTKGTYAFTPNTEGVPFSAHPRVEADGTLWNFGYVSEANLFVLWHIDVNGKLVKIGKIESAPITMVHDFIVTSKHIVLMVPPFHYSGGAVDNFLDGHSWQPEDPCRVLVVDKNDFDNHYWLELPSQWIFHFGNGWEDEAGIIRFDAARADDPLVMIDTFRDIMRGEVSAAASSHHHQYRIDTQARTITEAPMFSPVIDSEFPCVDPRVSCRQNQRLFMLSHDQRRPAIHANLNEVSNFDFRTGKRQVYRYPDEQIPEEHLFVPAPDSKLEEQGWVVGTALDWKRGITFMNVFDANHVDAGPIASAELPYALPLGLHGKFVSG